MSEKKNRVLGINPGGTSTKIGVYTPEGAEFERTLRHGDEEIGRFRGRPMIDRYHYRAELIEKELEGAGYNLATKGERLFAAVVARGGLLPRIGCGTYLVDEAMIEELRVARLGEHAANLGAPLARYFAAQAGVDAYIVDPPTVDEWQDCARVTGSPLVERCCIWHALNSKAVARRYAKEYGRSYESLRLIVAHMGSGITVSAHVQGRAIDSNTVDEGPFGPDRSGGLPVREVIRLCFSGRFTEKELDHRVFGDGGVFAYLGTRDLVEVERRVDLDDAKAVRVYEALVYQIAKEAGAMTAVLKGKVDAVLLTGGMAHSERLVRTLSRELGWIAPVHVYPGEDELQALAEGVFRVLNGEEEARRYLPPQ